MKIVFSEKIYKKLVGFRPFITPDEPGEIRNDICQYIEANNTSLNATMMMNNNGHENNYQDYLYMSLYVAGGTEIDGILMCKMEYKSPTTTITNEYQIFDTDWGMGQDMQVGMRVANAIWNKVSGFIQMAYMTRKNEIQFSISL